jgi:hypothetical protein
MTLRGRPAILALLLALAGCGGGFFFAFSSDGHDGHPTVSLAASPPSARSGDRVRLVAAASDDFGVERVSFFRLEANGGQTLLGSDDIAPYQIDVVVSGTGTAQFFARAFDDLQQSGDSETVSVIVLP